MIRKPHPTAGTFYFWCLATLAATASALPIVRWAEDFLVPTVPFFVRVK